MYSLSIDYVFNRVYDVLLWVKYTWLFTFLHKDKDAYLEDVSYRDWDGLRDRGWFDDYLALQGEAVPKAETHTSLWQSLLEKVGFKVRDSDGDGIPDVTDAKPYDSDNATKAELKERYEEDYSFFDHVRDVFGISPKDSDKDGVPDSYEDKHGLNKNDADTDHDGLFDGQELLAKTDPHNPDTDGDLVIDGRDEEPRDPSISSHGIDTDGDGVSDTVEKMFGSDPLSKDTDGDGIIDSMDTYILDPENSSKIGQFDPSVFSNGFHFSISNPLLSFFADMISIATVGILIIFVYVVSRWLLEFFHAFDHLDHHFRHDDNHIDGHHGVHVISHKEPQIVGGVAGLPVGHDEHVTPPEIERYDTNPKLAVIQGYMSSPSEALWRIGILEADNLLLEVLKEKGYQGEGLGEMLKGASFKTIDLAWDAHKVRNRIAHEGSTFELTEREAKRAYVLYESVFRDLKIMK